MSVGLKYKKLHITTEQINRLDAEEVALFGMLCLSVTEINVLAKIYYISEQKNLPNKDLSIIYSTQRFIIMRLISAKIFELSECIKKSHEKAKTTKLREFCIKSKDAIAPKNVIVKHLISNLRNEVTFHFPATAAEKNFGHISSSAELSLFLDPTCFNCFFPAGEEMIFAGRYNRQIAGKPKHERTTDHIAEWAEWIYSCANTGSDLVIKFAKDFIFSNDISPTVEDIELVVDDQIVQERPEASIPLFVRVSNP